MAAKLLPGWSETIEVRTRPRASSDAIGTAGATVGRATALLRLQATAGNRATARLVAQRFAAPQDLPVVQRTCGDGCGCTACQTAAGRADAVQRQTSDAPDLQSPRFAGDSTLNAVFHNRARVGPGSDPTVVMKIQLALRDVTGVTGNSYALGATGPEADGVDGSYGSKTQAAVRKFKGDEALGFTQYGDVGPGTIGRLDRLFSAPVLPPCSRSFGQDDEGAEALADVQVPGQSCDPNAPSKSACLEGAAIPFNRSGIVHHPFGTVGEHFEMHAEWKDTPKPNRRPNTSICAAECGEYRQFVRGHMRSAASADFSDAQDDSGKVFGGAPLEENTFHEDGVDSNPAARYGHRSEKQTMTERYLPDRPSGTQYRGSDFPNVSIGSFADIHLVFLGKTVDACNNDADTSQHTWTVNFRGKIRP